MSRMTDCPLCGTTLQRTPDGTLQDGVAAHYRVVHPGKAVPVVEYR